MQIGCAGRGLSITIGDFADVPVVGSYRLIFIVFNTLFNLLTQEDQIRCFQNVAKHLTQDGLCCPLKGARSFLWSPAMHGQANWT